MPPWVIRRQSDVYVRGKTEKLGTVTETDTGRWLAIPVKGLRAICTSQNEAARWLWQKREEDR